MDDHASSRRRLLGRAAALPLWLAFPLPGRTAAGSKEDFHYQDHAHDGKRCADCVQFVAPAACRVVAGTISPDGWCMAFTPK